MTRDVSITIRRSALSPASTAGIGPVGTGGALGASTGAVAAGAVDVVAAGTGGLGFGLTNSAW